jgi:hypothetical protein
MPETETNREEELRRLLTDAIEVQLAALKAGISFWSEWIEQTSTVVTSATKTLSSINEEQQTKDMLLELVDAGRASARALTEIPRHTATRFLEELDRLEEKKKQAEKAPAKKAAKKVAVGSAPAQTTAKKTSRRPRPKRAGRVKE